MSWEESEGNGRISSAGVLALASKDSIILVGGGGGGGALEIELCDRLYIYYALYVPCPPASVSPISPFPIDFFLAVYIILGSCSAYGSQVCYIPIHDLEANRL